MSDERARVVAEVDQDAKEILDEKLGHGDLSAHIRDLVNTIAYGGGWDRQQAIDKQLARKRQRLTDLRDKRRDINAKIETVEDEIRALEADREEIETKQEQFEGALWSFEQSFRAGEIGHVDPDHGRLLALADEFDKPAEDVHNELRERNPDIPGYAFETYDGGRHRRGSRSARFDGLPENEVGLPVDARADQGGDK